MNKGIGALDYNQQNVAISQGNEGKEQRNSSRTVSKRKGNNMLAQVVQTGDALAISQWAHTNYKNSKKSFYIF